MHRMEFNIHADNGTVWEVTVDYFDSMYRLRTDLDAMEPYGDHDYLGGAEPEGSWYGFKDADDLRFKMARGITDTKRMKGIRSLATGDSIKRDAKFSNKIRRAEEGDELYMDGFIRKDPKCWNETYRKRKPTQILDVEIVLSVPYYIDAKNIDKAAGIVASCILSLENKGFKTRVSAICGADMRYDDMKLLRLPLKTERERLNFPHLLFAASASFMRGVMFNWMNRAHHEYDMGCSLCGVDESVVIETVRTITGKKDANVVDIYKLASAAQHGRTEKELLTMAQDMIHYNAE